MDKVDGAQKILQVAQETVPVFLEFLGSLQKGYKGRTGGVISVRDGVTGRCLACSVIGNPPMEKVDKYFDLSFEKGKRLFENKDHLTSHESRDESKEQYGGAIVGDEVIVSFSGFPEKADSLFSLLVLQKCDGIIEAVCHTIVRRAQIEYLHKKWLVFVS